MSDEQTQQADDPSGPGWRDVLLDEVLQVGDMYPIGERWQPTLAAGTLARQSRQCGNGYRRRIEPPLSDTEPETMEDLRKRLAECEVLLTEADRGGQQVNAELQQLREQLATSHNLAEAQARLVDRLERWLRPVLEVVADDPEDCGALAVAVLECLPRIAWRLVKE